VKTTGGESNGEQYTSQLRRESDRLCGLVILVSQEGFLFGLLRSLARFSFASSLSRSVLEVFNTVGSARSRRSAGVHVEVDVPVSFRLVLSHYLPVFV
jgi:hypothetical protein